MKQPDDRWYKKSGCRAIVTTRLNRVETRSKRAPIEVFPRSAVINIKKPSSSAFAPRRWCHLSGPCLKCAPSVAKQLDALVDQKRPVPCMMKHDGRNACAASLWMLVQFAGTAVKKAPEDTQQNGETANKAVSATPAVSGGISRARRGPHLGLRLFQVFQIYSQKPAHGTRTIRFLTLPQFRHIMAHSPRPGKQTCSERDPVLYW